MGSSDSPVDYKSLVKSDRIPRSTEYLCRRDGISNIEVEVGEDGELIVGSKFILGELSIQAKHEMHWWVGRTTHRLRRVDGELRMSGKKVVLINAAEPLPNLAFLI